MTSNNTGTAIVGGDWPNALPVTTYAEPKAKQTGLDWAAISPPAGDTSTPATTAEVRAQQMAQHSEALERVERLEGRVVQVATPAPPAPTAVPKVRKVNPNSAAPRAEVLRPGLLADIRSLYYEDMRSTVEIGARFGLNPNTVAKVMRRNGMELRSGAHASGRSHARVKTRLAGLGVTAMAVRLWAREQGIGAKQRGNLAEHLVDLYEAAHS